MGKRYNPRKRVGGGKLIRNAHSVWNKHHPANPIKPGDGNVIHHKDGNKKNDSPKNLVKMPDAKHRSDHSGKGSKALSKWRKNNPEAARKQSIDNARKCNKIKKRKKI